MSEAKELLKAANYTWREEENPDRAIKIAESIIEQFPNDEIRYSAENLINEIQAFEAPVNPEPASAHDPVGSAPVISSVKITDVDIAFGSMVVLIIKFVFATIPAAMFVGLVYLIVMAILGYITI